MSELFLLLAGVVLLVIGWYVMKKLDEGLEKMRRSRKDDFL